MWLWLSVAALRHNNHPRAFVQQVITLLANNVYDLILETFRQVTIIHSTLIPVRTFRLTMV